MDKYSIDISYYKTKNQPPAKVSHVKDKNGVFYLVDDLDKELFILHRSLEMAISIGELCDANVEYIKQMAEDEWAAQHTLSIPRKES